MNALWYVGRGTGLVSILLLTLVVALGVANRCGRRVLGLPRFAVAAVHRSASLLGVVFVAVHVLTLLLDPDARLSVLDLVLPFHAALSPFWYGLGTVAFDLLAALVVTSLLRARIGPRVWRGVHWLAYACWPIALGHGLGSGSDAGSGWMLVVVGVCVAAVLGAVAWRFSPRFAEVDDRRAATIPRPTAGAR
ncbi:ferric reductase-like transmembrane domain-containing protein [Pseudonocardia acidicola]|uniref:Ferric oxidoreductase domain-containing protein n=1 Tax=Pseudonocardia acidicola TaxID=2724939 RepID=A0ABX1S801_9PSEU|nr:hypothetical protein [Pseudonocardia acidicola]